MKQNCIFLLFLLFLFSGCTKSKSAKIVDSSCYMSGLINQDTFRFINCFPYSTQNKDYSNASHDTLFIQACNYYDVTQQIFSYPQILLRLPLNNLDTGTYIVNESSFAAAYYINTAANPIRAAYGIIKISQAPTTDADFNSSFRGSFYITLVDSTSISCSSFYTSPYYFFDD